MLTVLEIILDRPKSWSKDWHDGYIFNVRGEMMPIVFDVAGYLTGGWIEKGDDEVLYFDKAHISVVYFVLIVPEAWTEIKDKIYIGMEMNAHAGSEIIGKAKLLEYEYYESYDIIDGKVISK